MGRLPVRIRGALIIMPRVRKPRLQVKGIHAKKCTHLVFALLLPPPNPLAPCVWHLKYAQNVVEVKKT